MQSQGPLYLKYRPQQLNEVVGHRNIVGTLKQASATERFSHAYLFSGVKGCGKTSLGRILATLMTCENVKDGMVCGECRACKTIHCGHAMDVKEMNGAVNRGIDVVRERILEGAQYSPSELKRKIFIIDECHRMTVDAESALLKILEEPPSYISFILCTTEPQKILDTILSRCQRFNVGRLQTKEIAKRLYEIAGSEEIKIEKAAAFLIGKLARGSMRDGIGYLEQVATIAGENVILEKTIQKYFALPDRKAIYGLVQSMINADLPLILDQVNDMIMASADAKQIMFEIADMFRNTMVIKAQNGKTNVVDLPDNEIEELKQLGQELKLPQLLKLSHLFADIQKKMSFNINERWIMEATLINCAQVLSK